MCTSKLGLIEEFYIVRGYYYLYKNYLNKRCKIKTKISIKYIFKPY